MTEARKSALRPVLATAAALAVVAAALLSSAAVGSAPAADPPAVRGAESCKGADAPAAETSGHKLRKSIRCLINEERAVHGFGKLARRRALQKASQRHAKTMVATDCLAHRCQGEVELEERLRQAGYFNGASSWQFAENTGCGLSAEAMVAGWMDVRFHRINILDKDFDDIGVGVVHKRVEDRCDPGFATFAVVFGHRTP
jgi:uncharacterized protein YkwD